MTDYWHDADVYLSVCPYVRLFVRRAVAIDGGYNGKNQN